MQQKEHHFRSGRTVYTILVSAAFLANTSCGSTSIPGAALLQDKMHDLQQTLHLQLPDSLTARWYEYEHNPTRKLLDSSSLNNTSTSTCSLCGTSMTLESDVVPMGLEGNVPPGTTCGTLSSFATVGLLAGSPECVGLQAVSPQCCSGGAPGYVCSRRVREKILSDDYDTTVPPLVDIRKPLPIQVNMVYISVTDINVQDGTAQIFVWLELMWKDERLAWTPGIDACASSVPVRASLDVQSSEIWVPDYNLLNNAEGVESMAEADATVFADGTVYWRRQGSLRALCQFSGLAQIPFDTLGCQFLFSSWASLGFGTMEISLANGTGLAFGEFDPTYNQYQLLKEESESGVIRKESGMVKDDVVYYTLWFQRATKFYMQNIVIPTIILTYVSFGTFLLDLRVGERLGFGISLALVVVAQQFITNDLIPISDASLWIDKFIAWSFYWVLLMMIESVLVSYVYFLRHGADEEDNSDDKQGHETAASKREDILTTQETEEQEGFPEQATGGRQKRHGRHERASLPMLTLGQRIRQAACDVPVRRLDHWCFVLACLTYTVYVIAMFMTVDRFGERVDPEFLSSDHFVVGISQAG